MWGNSLFLTAATVGFIEGLLVDGMVGGNVATTMATGLSVGVLVGLSVGVLVGLGVGLAVKMTAAVGRSVATGALDGRPVRTAMTLGIADGGNVPGRSCGLMVALGVGPAVHDAVGVYVFVTMVIAFFVGVILSIATGDPVGEAD